jgi:bifunctional non-homologous end joining protein LigD
MSLRKYNEKRDFKKSPEPKGGKPSGKELRFVVQKHAASHLHYDFRLEMEGVLKSWAVPKGPSMNPADKRLAMMVEDHPWDYRNFEGIIPSGYGAGTVIVWDEGTYEPVEKKKTKQEAEKHLLHHLYQGTISFILHGKKLKGAFTLVKTSDRGENAWLLMKKDDKYAKDVDITTKNASVLSGKTLEEVAAKPAREWKSHKESNVEDNGATKSGSANKTEITRIIKEGKIASKPRLVKPMKCELIDKPFDGEDWLFELKYDGYRIIADVDGKKVKLTTTEVQDYSSRYKTLLHALSKAKYRMLIDGEVVVLNEEGKPDFSLLQNYLGEGSLVYYVFDILWINGYDISDLEIIQRKELLRAVIPDHDSIKYVDHIDCEGKAFFRLVQDQNLEGIIAKRKDSIYIPGKRSKSWLKLPNEVIREYVIVGWTESSSHNLFARIMYGEMKGGKLYYKHHTGSSVSKENQKRIMGVLEPLEVKKKPVVNNADEETPIHWVKPVKVGRFKLKNLEETITGKPRHPVIFLGFRDDKSPTNVITVDLIPTAEAVHEAEPVQEPAKLAKASKHITAFDQQKIWKRLHKKEVTEQVPFEVEGKKLQLINLQQEYWPKSMTKFDVLNYYAQIHETILYYLKDRPLGLNIINAWGGEEGKFIRNAAGLYPEWVETFQTKRRQKTKEKGDDIDWVICNDKATLLYLVNLGALDFHPWAARKQHSQYPDYIVIDLDAYDRPDEEKTDRTRQEDRKNLIKTALAVKKTLDKHKLKSFIKTSGKQGLHILIPCQQIEYGITRQVAEVIASEAEKLIPGIATTESSVDHRQEKIYIDPSQNDYSDRIAVPYCLRANKIPTISTPLDWKEVNDSLDVKTFKRDVVLRRLEKGVDPCRNLLDNKIQESNSIILKSLVS